MKNCCDDRDYCFSFHAGTGRRAGGFTGPSTTTTTQAGGFTGPSGAVTTVANAKSLRDDTWVTLRGKIVERISDDLYKFQDASGVINVDIDHKRWNGVTVGPQDTVEIQGKSIRTGTR